MPLNTIATLVLVIIFCFPLKAQVAPSDFAPVGAIWHYRDYSFNSQNPLITIKSEKDTMVQTKNCRKVAVYLNDEPFPATYYIFHELNSQVYFYENGTFKMLYDFNLNVGDTMYNYQPTNRAFVDFTACSGVDEIDVPGKSVVDSVSYLVLNGDSLKTLHFGFSGEPYFFSNVTERIGSSNGLFGRYKNICPSGDDGIVRCYSDDRYFINFTGEQCDLLSGNKNVLLPSFNIYPNPTKEIVFFESEFPIKELRVFNSTGSVIHTATNVSELIMTDWVKGIYFFEINFKNEVQIIRKVIVE